LILGFFVHTSQLKKLNYDLSQFIFNWTIVSRTKFWQRKLAATLFQYLTVHHHLVNSLIKVNRELSPILFLCLVSGILCSLMILSKAIFQSMPFQHRMILLTFYAVVLFWGLVGFRPMIATVTVVHAPANMLY